MGPADTGTPSSPEGTQKSLPARGLHSGQERGTIQQVGHPVLKMVIKAMQKIKPDQGVLDCSRTLDRSLFVSQHHFLVTEFTFLLYQGVMTKSLLREMAFDERRKKHWCRGRDLCSHIA